MKIRTLYCPECKAPLDVEDDLDTFYCKYCGSKLYLDEQSDALLTAKVRVKEIEHETVCKKMAYEDKKHKRKHELRSFILYIAVAIILIGGIYFVHGFKTRKIERLVNEIQEDIDAGRYDEALVKTQQIRDDEFSSEDKAKWKATRKVLEKTIKERKRNNNSILVPNSASKYRGKPYKEVKAELKGAGFTNISTNESSKKPGIFKKNWRRI